MNKASARANRLAGSRLRILIIDDHPIARQGLRLLIDGAEDMSVCGEAADADSALDALASLTPDLAIVDLSLRGKSGLELIKDIRNRHRDLPMLVLSMHDENMYAERALRAGARGYIMKQEATDKILLAIRKVMAGEIYVSEAMTSRALRRLAAAADRSRRSSLELLSDRELEVFQLIGQGKSTREIARLLHLSIKTIDAYRGHIKNKLNLSGRNEVVRFAIQMTMEQS